MRDDETSMSDKVRNAGKQVLPLLACRIRLERLPLQCLELSRLVIGSSAGRKFEFPREGIGVLVSRSSING